MSWVASIGLGRHSVVVQYGRHLARAHALAHAGDDIQGARGQFTQHADAVAQGIKFVEQPVDFGQHEVAPAAAGQQRLDDFRMAGQHLLMGALGGLAHRPLRRAGRCSTAGR